MALYNNVNYVLMNSYQAFYDNDNTFKSANWVWLLQILSVFPIGGSCRHPLKGT